MEKQNLFTEEELAKVTDEAERKHLIECAQDQSKIDMKYMEIMNKYDLWEKGEHSRYFHATTHENAEKIMQDGMIRKGMDGGVYICKRLPHRDLSRSADMKQERSLKLNWKKGRLWKRTITTKPSSAAKHICTWMTYRHRRSCQCQDIQQSRRTTKSESL